MQYDKASEQPKIRVVIRKRPLNRKEAARGEQDVVEVLHSNEVVVREQKYPPLHSEPKLTSPNTSRNIISSSTTHSRTAPPTNR